MEEDKLSDYERKIFDELQREKTPPAHLQQRILSQLKAEGQLKRKSSPILLWAARLAAAVIFFVLGIFYGTKPDLDQTIDPARGYMLILHEDQNFHPGEGQQMFEEYSAWGANLYQQGIPLTGQELKYNEAWIDPSGEVRLADKGTQSISGYFILEANSLEQAIQFAQSNPHLKYGGQIEVKEFMNRN